MTETTTLADRMRELADTGHSCADDLRRAATEFDAATQNWLEQPDEIPRMKRAIGAWARARHVWCAATGEPLV